MLSGKGYWRAVVAMALCAPERAVLFSHAAGDCVFRLVWMAALEVMTPASDWRLLPAPRLEEGWQMAAGLAPLRGALLAARCVSVEYAARLEWMKAQAALMEPREEQPRHEGE